MPDLRIKRRSPPEQEIRTVSFVSLGCPKNLVDSEKMLGLLAEEGIVPVAHEPGASFEADAVVVNTCGFLEASKEESLGVIHEAIRAKEAGRVRRVVVAGCLVQRHRARMLEWAPGIDAMIGVFDRDHVVDAVRGDGAKREVIDERSPRYWIAANALQAARQRGRQTANLTVNGKDGRGVGYFEDDSARLRLTPRHYAYLRISEGCNQNCAFCTIPSIRGKMRSKPVDRIVAEARELLADGCFEINLIGQDTTSYGDDIGAGFDASGSGVFGRGGLPDLLNALSDVVAKESGAGWIRLMYAYPSNFREEFIEAFADLAARGRLLPYIDIPLQHASDSVLTRMRRNVSAAQQRALLARLRERIPGIAIRTTFISGFPGETEDDHRRLLDFVGEMRFDAMGVFEYSREEGTPAGRMEDDPALRVSAEVKARRRHELMALQQQIAFKRAKELASRFDHHRPADSGFRCDVLIDEAATHRGGRPGAGIPEHADEHVHVGRTTAQAPLVDSITYVRSHERLSPGELVPCTIVDADGYDLIARPTAEFSRRASLPILR
jgi:ribosomal protein S12 methylthiotransferase